MPKHILVHAQLTSKAFALDKSLTSPAAASARLPQNWRDDLKAQVNRDTFSDHIDKHVGSNASYTRQAELKALLWLIHDRLKSKTVPDAEKNVIKEKLLEGVTLCAPGFHNRVTEIIQSFVRPKNFTQLLQLVREDLVERAGATITDEIHKRNHVHTVASTTNLQVRGRNANDPHQPAASNEIYDALSAQFQLYYTPFHIPHLVCAFLNAQCAADYRGCLKKGSYDVGEMRNITNTLNHFLFETAKEKQAQPKEHSPFYFLTLDDEMDEITITRIVDIDWRKVERMIFDKLVRDNYFSQTPTPVSLVDLIYIDEQQIRITDEDRISIITTNDTRADIQDKERAALFSGFLSRASERLVMAFLQCETNLDWLMNKALRQWPEYVLKHAPLELLLKAFSRRHASFAQSMFASEVFYLYAVLNYWICNQDKSDDDVFLLLTTLISRINDVRKTIDAFTERSQRDGNTALHELLRRSCSASGSTQMQIQRLLLTLIQNIIDRRDLNVFIQGLCAEIKKGANKGTTGLYWWLAAIHNTAIKNSEMALQMNIHFTTLLDKITHPEDVKILLSGLCTEKKEDFDKGATGLYWWLDAINSVACENPEMALQMSIHFATFLDKITHPEDIKILLSGLCTELKEDFHKGKNALWWWIGAATVDPKINPHVNLQLIGLFSNLLEKITDQQALIMLAQGLCASAQNGKWENTSGLWWWMSSIDETQQLNVENALQLMQPFSALLKKINDPQTVKNIIQTLCIEGKDDDGHPIDKTGLDVILHLTNHESCCDTLPEQIKIMLNILMRHAFMGSSRAGLFAAAITKEDYAVFFKMAAQVSHRLIQTDYLVAHFLRDADAKKYLVEAVVAAGANVDTVLQFLHAAVAQQQQGYFLPAASAEQS